MSNTPIADHALLADRHSTALIDRSGSVEWLSFPRFDSPSVFGPGALPRSGAHQRAVLQGLSFQPSGAIVAAATSSLPEVVGGERNWDYRYSWVRDASFTIQAPWVAACPDEASNFFEFMTTAAASSIGPDIGLQTMFGVGGEHDLTERVLPHLPGWRDSRPVRVGNGAWNQPQIDVYGELLGAAAQLSEHIGTIDEDTRRFLIACAETAATSWTQKDRGIWEVRGNPQHFVYSKVMCWAALDRAIAMADLLHVADRVDGWKRQREEIWNIIARARPGVRKRALSRNTSGRPPWMPPT